MSLLVVPEHGASDRWHGLPDEVRRQVLTLLARLIARGVIGEDDPTPALGAGVADGR
jgi:hypothetical protein